MPLDFRQPNLLTGGNNRINAALQSFNGLSQAQVEQLAQHAPEACAGNSSIAEVAALRNCADAVCAQRNTRLKSISDGTGFNPFGFFAALRGSAFLNIADPLTLKALRYHLASDMADVFCKDPPNDGNRAVVTESQHAPAPDRTPLAVALIGLAALAAVRLGSLIKPDLRPAAPSLIQGIYIWMGLTPPDELIAPPTLDGRPLYNSYSGA